MSIKNDIWGDLAKSIAEMSEILSNDMKQYPASDIVHDDNEVFVRIALPGAIKDDIKYYIHDSSKLEISYVSSKPNKFCNNFNKIFSIGKVINVEWVNSSYKDGVLSIHLPLLTNTKNTRTYKVT